MSVSAEPAPSDSSTAPEATQPGPPPESDDATAQGGGGAPTDEEGERPLPGEDTEERPGLEKTRPGSVSEAHLKTVLESLMDEEKEA